MKNPKHYAESVNIILNYQLNTKGKTVEEIAKLFQKCQDEAYNAGINKACQPDIAKNGW